MHIDRRRNGEEEKRGKKYRKSRDKIVTELLMYSIPLHTPQFGRKEKLNE
jgi:hypothetical protein